MYAAAETRQNPYLRSSRSIKVIEVGTPGKLVSSARHDKLQVRGSVPISAAVFALDESTAIK